MRFLIFALTLLTTAARALAAEPDHPVANIYILRTAEQLSSPHITTYRVAEWAQMRGRWILPDFGYFDTEYAREQVWFTGAGADIIRRRRFAWEQEVYFSQEAGPESRNQRSLWLWPVLDFELPGRVVAQVTAYPTIPLDRAQPWSYDVDRAKLERVFRTHWKAGMGYAGGLCGTRTWESRPFATVTRKTPGGSFELWLQKTADGSQVQVRYLLITGDH